MFVDDKNTIKVFTDWIKLKVKIHLVDKNIFPKEGQIWWASIGHNIGVETNGKNDKFERPVLVLKIFNKDSSLIVPLSTKIKQGKYLISFKGSSGELNTANISQIRVISNKRYIRRVAEMNFVDFGAIRQRVKELF